MSRPCKSAALLSDCSQTKAELSFRKEREQMLRGETCELLPPDYLNENQTYIFSKIVSGLESSGILGELDTYLLAQCAVSIDRLQSIEETLNTHPELLAAKEGSTLVKAKDSYTRDFFRCCNELSLSPQSRAKLANINLREAQKQDDPLLKILSGGECTDGDTTA